MKEIDLSKYETRTDLIKDIVRERKIEGIIENNYSIDDIKVSNIYVNEDGNKALNKKIGNYTTIYFNDITDKDNFKKVEKVVIEELHKILDKNSISKEASCLIIGIGNSSSTPDSLGPKTAKNVLVTNYIKEAVGSLEQGFRVTYSLVPGVLGITGIESSDIILGVIERIHPDFIICIDALSSDSLDRVNKTIQITDTGISPGSGVKNKKCELSNKTLNIPVIAIGIPTVVDAVTIVSDTIFYMNKHLSYNIKNKDSNKVKLIPSLNRNYLINNPYSLDSNEKQKFMGLIGTLSTEEIKNLVLEVLTPIGYNLIVTPKEIDFVVDKLTLLLANSINKTLHEIN